MNPTCPLTEDYVHVSQINPDNSNWSVIVDVNSNDAGLALKLRQRIIESEKAIEVLGKIEIYVRMLQDGDPENEKPFEILDYIEKEVQPMLKVIYNE